MALGKHPSRTTRTLLAALACVVLLAIIILFVGTLLHHLHASLEASHQAALAAHPDRDPTVQSNRQKLLAAIPKPAAPLPSSPIPSAAVSPPRPIAPSPLGPVTFASPTAGLAINDRKAVAPVTFTAPAAGRNIDKHASAAPVSITKSPLTVGQPSPENALDFALHPSHYADPSRIVNAISLAAISREPSATTQSLAASTQPATQPAAPLTPYENACRLENSRRFVMSLCTDLQGRIWIGSEEDTPGTGGIQCFDPSKPPLEAFTQYTTKDGLGDNNGYAIACDLQGRIWVGHLNHGVSVFNGQKWQNYEVVGGLSRPDTLSGPLGERIFHITVCKVDAPSAIFHDPLTNKDSPLHGSVWICTSAGLSIYFPSTDTWSYLTRANGLPSDQANSLAFGPDGSLYLATQCDGIAIARSTDHYQHWTTITGPSELPTTASGDGLPTNDINDILVTKNGTIYTATNAGLTWSADNGSSWHFLRGADWSAKVRGSVKGPPANWSPDSTVKPLSEDISTSLAESSDNTLLIGHRETGADLLDIATNAPTDKLATGTITAFALCEQAPILGNYADGLFSPVKTRPTHASSPIATAADFPAAPTVPDLNILQQQLRSLPQSTTPGVYEGEDWRTQGDWTGRYGHESSTLCSFQWPWDDSADHGESFYHVRAALGPHHKADDDLRHWLQAANPDDPRALYDPMVGHRREADWDDHGEAYARTFEGPDLQVRVSVPLGVSRISFYFLNENGHSNRNRFRDYVMEIRRISDSHSTELPNSVHAPYKPVGAFDPVPNYPSYFPSPPYVGSGPVTPTFDDQPLLAKARVQQFWGGVYKSFTVIGPSSYMFKIRKNSSINTICSAVLIDRLEGPTTVEDTLPPFALEPLGYEAPKEASSTVLLSVDQSVQALWRSADDAISNVSSTEYQWLARIQACRATSKIPAFADNWRWNLRLWEGDDHQKFTTSMKQIWQAHVILHPDAPAHDEIPNLRATKNTAQKETR